MDNTFNIFQTRATLPYLCYKRANSPRPTLCRPDGGVCGRAVNRIGEQYYSVETTLVDRFRKSVINELV